MGPQTATARGRREDVTEERNAPSKRDVILDAARRVFLDVGYGAATVSYTHLTLPTKRIV